MRLIREINFEGKIISCIIEYKKIKNAYIRLKNDVIYVSASQRFTEDQIMNFIEEKYPILLSKQQKRIKTPKFFLWGKEDLTHIYSKETQSTYEKLLKNQMEIKTNSIIEKIKPNLSKMGLNLVPIKYKKLKSKYGSCHIIKKEITLNIFLAKIDPIFLEYVIYHEYAHLLVPNHSKDFYQVLDQMMPNHKQIQKELKKIPIIF